MKQTTHETFIANVAAIAARRLNPIEQQKIGAIKLVYGAGNGGVRGVTYYNRWKPGGDTQIPFVEISAFGQESWVQVAGTTLHELAHVLAGWEAGHGRDWKEACERVGLRLAKAAGHHYTFAGFAPDIREAIAALPRPNDGEPVQSLGSIFGALGVPTFKPRACPAGIGTRGGRSRGVGSGSRLRLWECECVPPVKVRVASDHFHAHCDCCSGAFHKH